MKKFYKVVITFDTLTSSTSRKEIFFFERKEAMSTFNRYAEYISVKKVEFFEGKMVTKRKPLYTHTNYSL